LLAVVIGDYAEAVTLGEEARRRSEARADKLNLQIALYVLASATYSQEQYQTALHHARQAYLLSEELGNLFFSAHLLGVMGNIVWALEDLDQAWEYYQTSYALKQELDDLGSMAFALNGMGGIAWIRGNYPEAERLYQQGYDLYHEVNDPGGLGTSLFGLGDTAQARGDYATAQPYFQQALEVAIRIHWPQLILTILVGVGDLLVRTGKREQAVELLALVAQHPAAEPPARHRAEQLLARAKTILPLKVFDAASARGKAAELDTVARSVYDQLKLPREYAPPAVGSQTTVQPLLESLSERELEILRLLAQGLTNQEIAEKLFLVVGTVKAHNHHIFGKLGVTNRVQAITRAKDLDLL
jgi:ATP/maltotriose-dependent transcriptional regulator MalT